MHLVGGCRRAARAADATPFEANAPVSYGKLPSVDRGAAEENSVQMTLKIMNRTSQAPPVCEP